MQIRKKKKQIIYFVARHGRIPVQIYDAIEISRKLCGCTYKTDDGISEIPIHKIVLLNYMSYYISYIFNFASICFIAINSIISQNISYIFGLGVDSSFQ